MQNTSINHGVKCDLACVCKILLSTLIILPGKSLSENDASIDKYASGLYANKMTQSAVSTCIQ